MTNPKGKQASVNTLAIITRHKPRNKLAYLLPSPASRVTSVSRNQISTVKSRQKKNTAEILRLDLRLMVLGERTKIKKYGSINRGSSTGGKPKE